jgi:signal transduction histidine kinase
MESANMGSWEWDTQADLIYWDNQTAQIMGIEETLVPRPFAEFIANVNPEFVVESFKNLSAIETYQEYNYVFPVTHKDKSVHWVKNYGKADDAFLKDGKSIRFNGTSLDVTDQHLYKELQASNLSSSRTDVISLNLEKVLREQFVSTLSHDLRNPLAAAKMSTDMLIRKSPGLPIMKFLNRISVCLTRVDHMIEDLLDANRIGAGQTLPLNKSFCDLNEVITDCLFGLRLDNGDRFVFAPGAPVVGHWDKFGLLRVFENLLTNAVKYGIEGTSITIVLTESPEEVSISFNNKSLGLTEAEQEKIFKPFHRTSSADNSNVRGWGLGLTIVKGIVEAHGGSVSISSILNEDVTFTVRLPHMS